MPVFSRRGRCRRALCSSPHLLEWHCLCGWIRGLVGDGAGRKGGRHTFTGIVGSGEGAWLWVDRSIAGNNTVLGLLRYLGNASMAIYLTHTAFTAAVRIVLLGVVIVVTMAAGLVLPLFVLWSARRVQLTKLLGF